MSTGLPLIFKYLPGIACCRHAATARSESPGQPEVAVPSAEHASCALDACREARRAFDQHVTAGFPWGQGPLRGPPADLVRDGKAAYAKMRDNLPWVREVVLRRVQQVVFEDPRIVTVREVEFPLP